MASAKAHSINNEVQSQVAGAFDFDIEDIKDIFNAVPQTMQAAGG